MARTHVKLVALGKKSSNGRRLAVADSTLDWDVEMSDASFRTRGGGEIALDDPQLLSAYDFLAQEIKRSHPYLSHWDGVPGQPTPQFAGVVGPQAANDRLYPKVPLTIEFNDPDMSPVLLSYPMGSGTIVTPWQRPPLATFDQSDFVDSAEFLAYLAERYGFLSNFRVSDLPLRLVRLGAPYVELGFYNLNLQFARGNLKDKNGRLQEDQILNRVSDILSRELRIPRTKALADVFLAALQRLAGLPSLDRLTGPSESLAKAILDALGTGPAIVSVSTAAEDWVALGTLVFYIGAIAYGYRWGTFTRGWSTNWWQLDAISRFKP